MKQTEDKHTIELALPIKRGRGRPALSDGILSQSERSMASRARRLQKKNIRIDVFLEGDDVDTFSEICQRENFKGMSKSEIVREIIRNA